MSQKVALLSAVRDELVATITDVASRVFVVTDDIDPDAVLTPEQALPLITLADGGFDVTWHAGKTGAAVYLVTARCYCQDVRGVEAPLLGVAATATPGVAALQALVGAALRFNLLAARLAGIEAAFLLGEGPAQHVRSGDKWALRGDVRLRYEMTEAG